MLSASSCSDDAATGDGTFIAFERDFQGFRAWPRVALGDVSAGGHPEGPQQFVYVSRARPAGARDFAVGTILMRTFEQTVPTDWVIFALVKRGGDYNAQGDVGWEYFRLRLNAQGRVVIAARGLNPRTEAPDDYGGGPGDGDNAGCNGCHGTAQARAYDGLLSAQLRPADP